MLDKIKILLGIGETDASQYVILSFLIESITGYAKRYCKIENIPKDMENVLVEIIVNRFRAREYGNASIPQAVTAVSDGDQSVSFKTIGNTEKADCTGFTDSEKEMLNLWRKVW